MKNIFAKSSLIVSLIVVAFSCQKETIPATGLNLSQSTLFLNIGANDTLTAQIVPSNATDATIKWLSSDTTIAKVDNKGIITAVSTGQAVISANNQDISSSCIIHVTKWSMIDLNSLKPYAYANNVQINCLLFDAHGNLWVGGPSLYMFDGSNWTTYLPDNGISAMAQDDHGAIWVGTNGYGLFKFDGTNWTNYTSSNSGLVDNTINTHAMAIDKQGNIWVGTSSRQTWKGTGVSKFDGVNWHAYTSRHGLIYDNVISIAADSNGNIWFGTNYGVSKFDGIGWISYTSSNTNNTVSSFNCIVEDSKGVLWFGTYPGGLLKFDGTSWISYNALNSKMAGGIVNSLATDKLGNIWVGTEAGLSKFDGTNWTNYTYNNGSVLNYIMSVSIDPKGNKWMGSVGNKIFELQE